MHRTVLILGVILLPLASQSYATEFIGLGDLAGGHYRSRAYDVSADGSVVVGESYYTTDVHGTKAFRWTADEGMVELPLRPDANVLNASALRVSDDGSSVVGYADYGVGYAALWQSDNYVNMGLGSWGTYGRATAISADGGVVVGSSTRLGDPRWWMWPDEAESYYAGIGMVTDMTPDGNTVVGGIRVVEDGNVFKPFRWTAAGGQETLGPTPFGTTWAVKAVSHNGNTIIGNVWDYESPPQGFIWRVGEGYTTFESLPKPPDNTSGHGAYAQDVSADGRVVVGSANWAFPGAQSQAFVWTEELGIRDLQELLPAQGVDLTGWNLLEAQGVSADGRTVVGTAINPDGNREAFLARFDPRLGEDNHDGRVLIDSFNDGLVALSDNGTVTQDGLIEVLGGVRTVSIAGISPSNPGHVVVNRSNQLGRAYIGYVWGARPSTLCYGSLANGGIDLEQDWSGMDSLLIDIIDQAGDGPTLSVTLDAGGTLFAADSVIQLADGENRVPLSAFVGADLSDIRGICFAIDGGAGMIDDLIVSLGIDATSTLIRSLSVEAVPEPATLGLLALGGLAMLKRRRA